MERSLSKQLNIFKTTCTILSGAATNFVIGSSLSFIPLIKALQNNPMYQKEKNVKLCLSLLFISSNITNGISPFIFFTRNIRTNLILAYSIMIISFTILGKMENYFLQCLVFIFLGIGLGLPYLPIIKNINKNVPNYSCAISYIFIISFSISSPLLYWCFDKLINRKIILADMLEVIMYFLILFGCISVLGTFENIFDIDFSSHNNSIIDFASSNAESEISLSKLKPPSINVITERDAYRVNRPLKDPSRRDSFISLNSSNTLQSISTNLEQLKSNNSFTSSIFEESTFNNLRCIFTNMRIYIKAIYMFCAMALPFFILFITLTEKYKWVDPLVFIMSASICRFVLPIVESFISHKAISLVTLVLQMICGLTFFKSNHSNVSYYMNIAGCGFVIHSLCMSSLIVRVYGQGLSLFISGFTISVGCLSSLIFPLMESIFIKEKNFILYSLWFVSFLSLVAFALNLFLIEQNEFSYSQKKKSESKEESQLNMENMSVDDIQSET